MSPKKKPQRLVTANLKTPPRSLRGGTRAGAGRPKQFGNKKSINLPDDLCELVDFIATKNGETFNAAIIRVLRLALGGGG